MNFFKRCVVKPGQTIDLETIDPNETFGWSKRDALARTEKNLARIAKYQEMMHAEQKHALLLCLQAMDTGGKDGTVTAIGGPMNPAGLSVVSFKQPTPEELAHDFLWRIEKQLPQKAGQVVIFNRSHYEDVGVVRVHNLVPESVWKKRYALINTFEAAASKPSPAIPGGTHILKFFLHISPDEQLKRLNVRMDEPSKNWKISEADFKERPYWHDYMKAFSEAISKCSTEDSPWFVIPANNKWMRDLIISEIVADTLKGLDMSYPQPATDIKTIRQKYFEKDGALKAKFDVQPLDAEPAAEREKPRRKLSVVPK